MTASEIIKQLSPAARSSLAGVPGSPVAVGAVPVHAGVRFGAVIADELRRAGVIGPRGGLTIRGAAVADRIKAESEPF
jgi:hypothetical protein